MLKGEVGGPSFLMTTSQSSEMNLITETEESMRQLPKHTSSKTGEKPESQVLTSTIYSKTLGMDWNYDIYLPRDYDENSDKAYPIIYLLHGIFGNHRNMLERYDSQAILEETMKKENQQALVV